MQTTTSAPKRGEGTWLWLYKIVAGVLIVVLLGVHFLVNHLLAPGGLLSYAEVIQYYMHPIVPIMELIFLVVVVSHALIGLRGILLDLNPTPRVLRTIDVLFWVVGVVSVVYGAWLIWVIVQRGNVV